MTDTHSNKLLRSVGGANVPLAPAEQKHTPGPWTYFVGNANGRGLIRVEADHDSPAAGTHIASLTRDRVEDAKLIISAVNERDRLRADNAELLEALEDIVRRCNETPESTDWREINNVVNDALSIAAKALSKAGKGTP